MTLPMPSAGALWVRAAGKPRRKAALRANCHRWHGGGETMTPNSYLCPARRKRHGTSWKNLRCNVIICKSLISKFLWNGVFSSISQRQRSIARCRCLGGMPSGGFGTGRKGRTTKNHWTRLIWLIWLVAFTTSCQFEQHTWFFRTSHGPHMDLKWTSNVD